MACVLVVPGLRYDDLIRADEDVDRALTWLPENEMLDRDKRLRRAIDLGSKHEELPAHIQAVQDPHKVYLRDFIDEARDMREERKLLDL